MLPRLNTCDAQKEHRYGEYASTHAARFFEYGARCVTKRYTVLLFQCNIANEKDYTSAEKTEVQCRVKSVSACSAVADRFAAHALFARKVTPHRAPALRLKPFSIRDATRRDYCH